MLYCDDSGLLLAS